MLTMALGFKYNQFIPISSGQKHSGGYCRVESLTPEDKSLIKAISVYKTKEVNTLISLKDMYQIAEAYANGGVPILKELINRSGDLFINLSVEITNPIA